MVMTGWISWQSPWRYEPPRGSGLRMTRLSPVVLLGSFALSSVKLDGQAGVVYCCYVQVRHLSKGERNQRLDTQKSAKTVSVWDPRTLAQP